MLRLLYVDDHPLFCEGLARLLAAEIPALSVETASTREGALHRLAELDGGLDLCLSDQHLSDGEGAEIVEIVRTRFPLVAAGVLTGEVTQGLLQRLRAVGAVACLSKERPVASIVAAIQTLLSGEPVFDSPKGPVESTITDRRREIVRLAAKGFLDKQIGAQMKISESAVRNHWQFIFERLGATNRTEALSIALRRGLI